MKVLTNYQIFRALRDGQHPFHVWRKGRPNGDIGKKRLVWGRNIDVVRERYPDQWWNQIATNVPSSYIQPVRNINGGYVNQESIE